MVERLVLGEGLDAERVIEITADALAAGGVVAVPTDTVYGLACRSAFPSAIDRIYALKGRPSDKALPWLVPDVDAAFGFVNVIPPRALRLMRAFWPGALTIVLGEGHESVALRLPDHDVLREILRRAGGPVVATSANLSGAPAATSAGEIERDFGDRIDVIVDGGPARLGRESTIIAVRPDGGWSLLRQGYVPESVLRPVAATRVLFVCSGNTCRSPMAAAALTRALEEKLHVRGGSLEAAGYVVKSAGIHAASGAPASLGALTAGRRSGLDLSAHRSAPLSDDDVVESDFVFVMCFEHLVSLRRRFGRDADRAELLDPEGAEVDDPFGGSAVVYEASLRKIESFVHARIPAIIAHGGLPAGRKSN